jgi:glycosyltransferase involved in cell wall biosynthesis
MLRYRLSLVVVAYNMARELPRTIRSLSPAMQQGLSPDDYEIVVVDNGSATAVNESACSQWGGNLRFNRMQNAQVSPSAAINFGLSKAHGELIGVMIDGARMASPGLMSNALRAASLCSRPVIASLGFHLGSEVQMQSVTKGYNQQAEDALLSTVDWPADGYKLFDISTFAGSSAQGWFHPIGESNALFLRKEEWRELGGFDEAFVSPGGGLVNPDTYLRACELPNSQLIILLGEGTFHQVHGGVATNALVSPWSEFHEEYMRLRGKPFAPPAARPWYFGQVPPQALKSIELSAQMGLGRGV